ncbi:MAG: esterase/lipase family protein [Solirubrobacteraceae bacterium]
MGTDGSAIPRLGLPLTAPRPRVLAEWLSTRDPERWPAPPAGAGRPVMLLPGFMAGDQSLTRMAVWLRSGGFVLARSGIRWNSGCREPTAKAVERRLERAVERTGKRALVVGQSRGGSIGRALAVLRPDLIESLVTLGSPLRDQLAVRLRVWPSIITVGVLGTLGVPGMFSFSCIDGDCCARTRAAVAAPFPADVGFVSIYSPSDEVVRWEACLDPAAVQIEVDVSHIGMGMARAVWVEVADELRRTVAAAV